MICKRVIWFLTEFNLWECIDRNHLSEKMWLVKSKIMKLVGSHITTPTKNFCNGKKMKTLVSQKLFTNSFTIELWLLLHESNNIIPFTFLYECWDFPFLESTRSY